jgi:hypothetical protein
VLCHYMRRYFIRASLTDVIITARLIGKSFDDIKDCYETKFQLHEKILFKQ